MKKIIALVDPENLRYVLTCEPCANRRNKGIPMIVMYFKSITEALVWSAYVRFHKSYWQHDRRYRQCQHVACQIATNTRRNYFNKKVA